MYKVERQEYTRYLDKGSVSALNTAVYTGGLDALRRETHLTHSIHLDLS